MFIPLVFCLAVTQSGGMMGSSYEYKDGDVTLEGYLAKPMQDVVAPIVIVVHQWGGLGDYERQRCDMLAQMGYVAFGADIYGKGVRPKEMSDKAAQAQKYKSDRKLYRSRLAAALDAAKAVPGVYADRVAVIGYCFGGTGALEVARMGADVKGVVSFHGGLDGADPQNASRIKAKVLVLHGADDPFVPAKDIEDFMAEMRAGKVDWSMVSYGNAVHSFTEKAAGNDNSRGAAYNADADARSWRAMQDFLREVL
ncbi:dienelactone hydrolase family protein [Kamptonema cortianum]|nr:dienelactone hydrolase family protein [Geitlerinema splendidum]MDK3158788.1 dienelactone hydrolase family protein [Kamptonema cortianum]